MSSLKKMKVISIMWGMILFGLLLVITIFGFMFKKKSKPYYELGNELVSVVRDYVVETNLLPHNNETIKITFDDLNKNNYMDELKVNDDSCEGYVLVTNKKGEYIYKPYLKCEKFISAKYKLNDK